MRVGLKYCGGCNPRYDRAAFARWLAAQHEDWEVTYAEREEAYDLLLVVSGCSAACASTEGYRAKEMLRYSSENLPEGFPGR